MTTNTEREELIKRLLKWKDYDDCIAEAAALLAAEGEPGGPAWRAACEQSHADGYELGRSDQQAADGEAIAAKDAAYLDLWGKWERACEEGNKWLEQAERHIQEVDAGILAAFGIHIEESGRTNEKLYSAPKEPT